MAKKRKKCPFCGAEVNKDNLNRHFLKVHGDLSEKDFKKKGLKMPAGAGGRKPRQVGKRASKKGNKITKTVSESKAKVVPEIASYSKNL